MCSTTVSLYSYGSTGFTERRPALIEHGHGHKHEWAVTSVCGAPLPLPAHMWLQGSSPTHFLARAAGLVSGSHERDDLRVSVAERPFVVCCCSRPIGLFFIPTGIRPYLLAKKSGKVFSGGHFS